MLKIAILCKILKASSKAAFGANHLKSDGERKSAWINRLKSTTRQKLHKSELVFGTAVLQERSGNVLPMEQTFKLILTGIWPHFPDESILVSSGYICGFL